MRSRCSGHAQGAGACGSTLSESERPTGVPIPIKNASGKVTDYKRDDEG